MKNSKLLKSLFFIGWGGFFLFNSLDYKIGTILNPGAGWFPFYRCYFVKVQYKE
jgi:hypothetical protein